MRKDGEEGSKGETEIQGGTTDPSRERAETETPHARNRAVTATLHPVWKKPEGIRLPSPSSEEEEKGG